MRRPPGGPSAGAGSPNTLGTDGQPIEALVLMPEPALPGVQVQARPIAVLRLITRDGEADELVCVADDHRFDDLRDISDLPRWHAEPPAWAAVLQRLSPRPPTVLLDCAQRADAERWLTEAQEDFTRLTGNLEWA